MARADPPRVGWTDLRDLSRDLRRQNKRAMIRTMTKEIRKASKPALVATRKAILNAPSQGVNARRHRPSLRKQLSRATVLQIKTNRAATVVIKTDPKKMREGLKGIPPYVEGISADGSRRNPLPWRHPLFGNEPWIQQTNIRYFYDTIDRHRRDATASIERAAFEIRREIERGH